MHRGTDAEVASIPALNLTMVRERPSNVGMLMVVFIPLAPYRALHPPSEKKKVRATNRHRNTRLSKTSSPPYFWNSTLAGGHA
jgi:hypothetical protein